MEPIPGAGPIETRRTFGDVQLHVEWSTPNPPGGTGQDRGNSGVFLMGEFEVQVLDSYKSDTYADGQAGAIYGQYPPLFNASRAPGQWQTYDIAFRRARFDTAGKLLEPARMTVFQNGVLIQNNEEPFGPTAWLKWLPYSSEQGEHGAIRLQDHGQPVRYRNIWVSELPERPAPAASDLARPTVVSLPTQTLDRYVGHYLLGAKADGPKATIEREGDHLTLAFPFRPQPLVLEPISDREFSLPDTDARLTFLDDAHGHVLGVRLRVGDGEDSWKRGSPRLCIHRISRCIHRISRSEQRTRVPVSLANESPPPGLPPNRGEENAGPD